MCIPIHEEMRYGYWASLDTEEMKMIQSSNIKTDGREAYPPLSSYYIKGKAGLLITDNNELIDESEGK